MPVVKIFVAWIGKTKEPAIQSLTDEYVKRISRYTETSGLALKDEASLRDLARGLRNQPRHFLVLLDSGGKQMSSEDLAAFVQRHADAAAPPLLFAIGPADGFSLQTRAAADLTLSLGKMTLTHELARVVLLEQIYRAFTILKKHPYHHAHR